MSGPFGSVLIANRGEIACRIIRTLRRLDMRSVVVHSGADAEARHVRLADEAVRLEGDTVAATYLDADQILDATTRAGVEAVHPGYGFLAENADFARRCSNELVWVGPPAEAIAAMGDKIAAKRLVAGAGVPVVPGGGEPGFDDDDLAAVADEIGYPVLVKPSAGGGGKGMRLVRDPDRLRDALLGARREAAAAFGDDTLLVERWIDRPRHVEIQVLADGHGGVIHLGERECSLQRRHQKIVEEAPSLLLDAARREAMATQAVAAARACGYVNAGTVEFIVSGERPDDFFFMEMNTRLQVEHPVTELVWGVDLVELQLRVAAGEPLPFAQDDLAPSGHAVEARVYAEDPAAGFLPSTGRIGLASFPSIQGVRVDRGVDTGDEVTAQFDPLLAKVIAHGDDRASALDTMRRALEATHVLGVRTNIGFLQRLLGRPEVRSGDLDTGLVERIDPSRAGAASSDASEVAALAAVADFLDQRRASTGDVWQADAWRVGDPGWWWWRRRLDGEIVEVACRPADDGVQVRLDPPPPPNSPPKPAPEQRKLGRVRDGGVVRATLEGDELVLADDGTRFPFARAGDTFHLGASGHDWRFERVPLVSPEGRATTHAGELRSPMPGQVIEVPVSKGEVVEAGQGVVVLEAMKMEHTIRAPFVGRVAELRVVQGDQVVIDALLAVIEPHAPIAGNAETDQEAS